MTNVRLDIPHRDGCNRQWVVIDPSWFYRHRPDRSIIEQRDVRGRKHQHAWRNWLTLICNDTACPAIALVRCDVIEQLATEALDNA